MPEQKESYQPNEEEIQKSEDIMPEDQKITSGTERKDVPQLYFDSYLKEYYLDPCEGSTVFLSSTEVNDPFNNLQNRTVDALFRDFLKKNGFEIRSEYEDGCSERPEGIIAKKGDLYVTPYFSRLQETSHDALVLFSLLGTNKQEWLRLSDAGKKDFESWKNGETVPYIDAQYSGQSFEEFEGMRNQTLSLADKEQLENYKRIMDRQKHSWGG